MQRDNLLHYNKNDIKKYAFLLINYKEDRSNLRPKRDVSARR